MSSFVQPMGNETRCFTEIKGGRLKIWDQPINIIIYLVDYRKNDYNYCHHVSDFKAQIHQIRFQLGLRFRSL